MEYQILPTSNIWQEGSFFMPVKITASYIKLASEYQLKALLLILSTNGRSNSREIAKVLGCTESDADDFLDFWVEEGVLTKDGNTPIIQTVPATTISQTPQVTVDKPAEKKLQSVPVPTLSPKNIDDECKENEELAALMSEAQVVLGKTLSHIEQELIVNMVSYYGLPSEIVLTILHYYKSQKEKGKARGTMYIAKMAKNWSEEGITTLDAADEKLKDIENSNRLWEEIVGITGIKHGNPTVKQRNMIKSWFADFSREMIALACDIMKENTEKISLSYADKVLKNWKKKGISTPAEVQADNEKHRQAKESKSDDIDSTYDINEIAKKAMFDDNYDI